jgi:phosphoribosylanthranilate isomerase
MRGRAVAPQLLFHVKVCGVMSADDARLATDAGADAIGLNFVPGSPRCLDPETAAQVAAAVPDHVLVVGVFAATPPAEMRRVAAAVGLDAIQLHGRLAGAASDPPDACPALAPLAVIRAVRLTADGFGAAREWLTAAGAAGNAPVMAVVDAAVAASAHAGALGGTGAVVDWEGLAAAGGLGIPLALAGGLTPDNVAAAIAATGAEAVDTASGVEQAPGRKDPEKVRRFCHEALAALARTRR